MTIRTDNDFSNFLLREFTWRKKEIIAYKSLIESQKEKILISTLVKSGIVIFYSHWEGFIKEATKKYLEYIASKGIEPKKFKSNFITLYLKSNYNQNFNSGKFELLHEITIFYLIGLDKKQNLDPKNIIPKIENLKPELLKEIIISLGFDYSPYELFEKLISENLLFNRNKIAHGELSQGEEYTRDDFILIFEKLLPLLEQFRNDLDNSIYLKSYLIDTNHS